MYDTRPSPGRRPCPAHCGRRAVLPPSGGLRTAVVVGRCCGRVHAGRKWWLFSGLGACAARSSLSAPPCERVLHHAVSTQPIGSAASKSTSFAEREGNSSGSTKRNFFQTLSNHAMSYWIVKATDWLAWFLCRCHRCDVARAGCFHSSPLFPHSLIDHATRTTFYQTTLFLWQPFNIIHTTKS